MIVETVTFVSDVLAADTTQIDDKLKGFVAPIAAVLIGCVGLKYLFGEDRSLAKFIGFVFLGVCVYALIQFGSDILGALGGVVKTILT